METILFEVNFYDGRKFNVFCSDKNQQLRFRQFCWKQKAEIEQIKEISSGIHTIAEFEKITTNSLN